MSEPVLRDEPAQASGPLEVHLQRPQVAVVEADEPGAASPARASSSRSSWASTSGSRPRSRASPTSRPAGGPGGGPRGGARGRRRPPAGPGSWRSSTTNSLARTGTLTAARTARRSSIEPPNQCGSHRTEIATAPPAWYARARATRSSPCAAIAPADGEERLISAMRWRPGTGEPAGDVPRRGRGPRPGARARGTWPLPARRRRRRPAGRRSRRRPRAWRPAAPVRDAGGAAARRPSCRAPPASPTRPRRRPRRARSARRAGAASRRLGRAAVDRRARQRDARRRASPCGRPTVSPAAALSRTTSRRGPGSPASTPSTSRAFSSGVPPASSAVATDASPSAAGSTAISRTPGRIDLVDDARAIERQLVDARAVDDERPLRAEPVEHRRDPWRGRGIADADDEPPDAGRVRQRAEEVERRPDADLAAGRAGVAHRRVEARREHEREAVRGQGGPGRCGVVVDPDAEGVEDVGRAGARRDRPVAVLGDRDPGGGDDERRGRRDVERAALVAAGPDDVDRPVGRGHVEDPLAHRGREAGQLVDRSRRASGARRGAPPAGPAVASPSMTAPIAARASSSESVRPSTTVARAAPHDLAHGRTAGARARRRAPPVDRPWPAPRRRGPCRPSRTNPRPRRAARPRPRRPGGGSWPAGAGPAASGPIRGGTGRPRAAVACGGGP